MAVDTRQKLVHSAQKLMLQKGYSATGVDDLCRDAEVSKGSFYHQFSSKEELALAALQSFYEAGLRKLLSIDLSGIAAEDRLLAFLAAVAKQGHDFWQDGCLLGSLASEMALTSPALQAEVAELFAQTAKALEPLAEPFVATLQDPSLSAATLAEQFLVVVEGAIVLSRAHGDPLKINQAVARFAEQLRWLPRRQSALVPSKKRAQKT